MCQHMTHDTYAYDVAMAHQSATRVNELLRARHVSMSYSFIIYRRYLVEDKMVVLHA